MKNGMSDNKLSSQETITEKSENNGKIKIKNIKNGNDLVIIHESEKEILKNIIMTESQIKTTEFFFSQFGFMIPLIITVLLLFIIPEYHPGKIFTSKISGNTFDPNYIPKIFIHTTDIHCSTTVPNRLDSSTIFLQSLYDYKPDLFLLTGDYVDNFLKTEIKFGDQRIKEWEIYDTAVKTPMSRFNVIDVSGNHDIWAVKSVTSESHNFLKYSFIYNKSNVKNERDFFLKTVKFDGISFILLNDYRFPVIRPPYGVEPHTTSYQLDLLEDMIDKLEEDEYFFLSHYAVDRACLTKSSKGHSFEEIISNKKIGFLFTGHNHPKKVNIIHHGSEGGLEFVTSAAIDKRAGLITIDNGNLIYHEVYIPYYGKKPLFFLTYPVPNDQISSHHIFNLNNFEIRLISYAPDHNIILKIEGDITGQLNYVKTLNNGAFLYSYPVNLPNGKYKIHIYDENGLSCNINREFIIGQKYKGKKEKYSTMVSFLLGLRFLIIPIWLMILIIIFPFFPDLNLNIVKNCELYIEGELNIAINKYLLYLYLILLSPLFLRLRFQKNIKILKYAINICFIYPLILPLHFMSRFEGIIGYSFLIFVVVGNKKVIFESWSLQFTFLYLTTILFPWLFFASGKKYYNKKKYLFIIPNIIYCMILFVCGMIINFVTLAQSLYFPLLFFTTGFIIVFILLLILFIKYFKFG